MHFLFLKFLAASRVVVVVVVVVVVRRGILSLVTHLPKRKWYVLVFDHVLLRGKGGWKGGMLVVGREWVAEKNV